MSVYWISKYALTQGVYQKECKPSDGSVYVQPTGSWWGLYKLGKDAHETLEQAIKAAEAMKAKRVASLRKQLKALEDAPIKVDESMKP